MNVKGQGSRDPHFQLQGTWKEDMIDRKWLRSMRQLKMNINMQLSSEGRWMVDCDDGKYNKQGTVSLSSKLSGSGGGNSDEEWQSQQRRSGNINVVVQSLLYENTENHSKSANNNQGMALNWRTSVMRASGTAAISSDTNLAMVGNNGRNIQVKGRFGKKGKQRRKMWKGHNRPLMLHQYEV